MRTQKEQRPLIESVLIWVVILAGCATFLNIIVTLIKD